MHRTIGLNTFQAYNSDRRRWTANNGLGQKIRTSTCGVSQSHRSVITVNAEFKILMSTEMKNHLDWDSQNFRVR